LEFLNLKILLKNYNEKLELLNSFQKIIFDKQNAATLKLHRPRPPLLRHCTDVWSSSDWCSDPVSSHTNENISV